MFYQPYVPYILLTRQHAPCGYLGTYIICKATLQHLDLDVAQPPIR